MKTPLITELEKNFRDLSEVIHQKFPGSAHIFIVYPGTAKGPDNEDSFRMASNLQQDQVIQVCKWIIHQSEKGMQPIIEH